MGKAARFHCNRDGSLFDSRSVEGHTAQQVHGIKVRESIRPSVTELPPQGCFLRFGVLEELNRGKRKSDHRRFAITHGAADMLHLEHCLGPVEYATPIFLARLNKMPLVSGLLDTDEEVLAFEQRCHDLGNVYRHDGLIPWELPSLSAIPTRVPA